MIGACAPAASGSAHRQGDAERGPRLAGAADARGAAIGEPCPPDRPARLTRRRARACEVRSGEACALAGTEGRAMTPEQAIADTLEADKDLDDAVTAPSTRPSRYSSAACCSVTARRRG
jgi:hypothetical protein